MSSGYRDRARRLLAVAVVLLLAAWILAPVARAFVLTRDAPGSAPSSPGGLPARPIQFSATDGVSLRGWFVPGRIRSAGIVLVPGFKDTRAGMLPYASLLHAAGYSTLLYDPRGTGESGGHFSLGMREVRDVLGALRWLRAHGVKREGSLGVSLGAGDVIVAASRDPHVLATVADSPYPDQQRTVDRLNSLDGLPLAPLGPWAVDHLLGAPLASFSPLRAAPQIAPRALLLIHARYDSNPTTPLIGVEQLRHACRAPCSLWLAPKGIHAGALAAQPGEYARLLSGFFARYLRASY